MPSDQRADHWDAAYLNRGCSGVSWIEPTARTSVDVIERLQLQRDAAVIDIGGGASVLADGLVERGFTDVSVLDVSGVALAEVRRRPGSMAPFSLLEEDLLAWRPRRRYDLWHDRAVFHFLVDAKERGSYVRTLRSALQPEGLAIIATFAPDGPEYCSGLPVSRYSGSDLVDTLGPQFQVVEDFRDRHVTPTGVEQPFTWVAVRYIATHREGRVYPR